LGNASYAEGGVRLELAARHLPATVAALTAEGWHVEAEGRVHRAAGKFELQVSSGIDWFELHGTVNFGTQTATLPELLAALRRGAHTVKLGDGSVGLLPQEWLKRYAALVGLGEHQGDALRFRRSQAGFLDALLAAEPDARCDTQFAQLRQQLRNFGFGGCLADDMGLGKTVQVLALLEERRAQRAGPSLAVVPRARHFADHDLVLTTYGTLRNDAADLRKVQFDYLILDESQAIKNAGSVSAKAVRLLHGTHRLALSGTRSRCAHAHAAGARGAPVHPASDQATGCARTAAAHRADPVLRSRRTPAQTLQPAARPLPRQPARKRQHPWHGEGKTADPRSAAAPATGGNPSRAARPDAAGRTFCRTRPANVFLLDPWWNPAVEAQAIDRAHRIGQTRQVFACRLIARDTVEEKVLELQAGKRALADAIIGADEGRNARAAQFERPAYGSPRISAQHKRSRHGCRPRTTCCGDSPRPQARAMRFLAQPREAGRELRAKQEDLRGVVQPEQQRGE
jgi:hypothetical protein